MSKKGFGKFVLGAGIGAAIGLLFAPKTGEETRKDLKRVFDEMKNQLKDLSAEDVKEIVEEKIEQIQVELDNLDKEKVLSVAKKQAKKIENMATELVEYAKDKATPMVEKSAIMINDKVAETTEKILKKLEK